MRKEELELQIITILHDPTLSDSDKAQIIAQILSENPGINRLDFYNKIKYDDITILTNALRGNNTIATLNLSTNKIDDAGASALAEGLKGNSTITSLELAGNKIGDAGASALADALKVNSTIRDLCLRDNRIQDDGASAIAHVLAHSNINTLVLEYNQIGDAGAAALAQALENSIITRLYLTQNNIGDAGAAALAQALKKNKTITKVYLRDNQIGDAGAEAIAQALEENTIITSLKLGSNQIGAAGAKALAGALKKNKTITKLNLGCNKIGDQGAVDLSEGLKGNSTIRELFLEGNQIGDQGAADLIEACKTKASVTILYLASNSGISPQGAKQMLDALISPIPESIQQMLEHKLDPQTCLTLAQKTPNAQKKSALQNIHTLLTKNTSLDLSMIFFDTWYITAKEFDGPEFVEALLHSKKIEKEIKDYIDSVKAPTPDKAKPLDLYVALACQKHPALQEYLASEDVKAKVKDTILSDGQLCKSLLKQYKSLQLNLNDDTLREISKFLDFWDIAKLCIAKLLPNQETEDLSTDTAPCAAAAAEEPMPEAQPSTEGTDLGAEQTHTAPDITGLCITAP